MIGGRRRVAAAAAALLAAAIYYGVWPLAVAVMAIMVQRRKQ